ncbi:GntR family transcriptional regulator [Lederbergia citri]|uniref:GntR family transcriptional regulator n=1 Tax=Lederbergia citri TaxID=2833580 RepID=A0A942TD84_9BACI|nr:GntR family transcriptional regulator [Lederbergia citri]MBS4195776.1 GntR family transcriptional regulator [Lederbergia citri]
MKDVSMTISDEYKPSDRLIKVIEEELKRINRQNPMPLYHQLIQVLQNVIEKEKMEPGSFFATEILLQELSGMSRNTVRKALEELVRKGYLIRVVGKGTFISIPDAQVVVPQLKSLTQELTERGMKAGAVFLDAKWVDLSENISRQLNGEKRALLVRRIRTGNGIPLFYTCAYIPEYVGLNVDSMFTNSLYEMLAHQGWIPKVASHTIKGVIITSEVANLLGVPANSAGLLNQRITYDESERPIVYEEGVGRGDLYSYKLNMRHYS